MKFLGLDIGTGGSRAIVIDENGNVLASGAAGHENFASPQIGWAEQDPNDWWRACKVAIKEVLESVPAEEIAAIGLSGQMHGSVLLDNANRPLRPALLWCDQRTALQCSQITERAEKENLIELVCNRAVTGFTLPKLLWIRENESDVWDRTEAILLPKDFVRLKLSGDKASDVADSSGTLLFDVRNRKWSEKMFEMFGIDIALMPKVFESIEATGEVSKSAAIDTGLMAGTIIVAGAGDNASGAIGMGITRPGMLSVTIGTSGVVFGVTEKPAVDQDGRIHTLCHAIPDRWHNTGVTLSAGLSLNWFRQTFDNKKDFDELGEDAAKIQSGSDGVIWLPYLMGERTPHLDPNARAAFVGLTASTTKAQLTRAVMEGVAFSLRDSLELFRQSGVNVESIRLGGGGARSETWGQIQADVYGKKVDILEADEGAAFGAAILAGVCAGAWDTVDEACERTIRVARTIEPDMKSVSVLNRNYEAYGLLYDALFPVSKIISNS